VPDRLDPSESAVRPVQVEVDGRPLVLDRARLDDTHRFVSPTARIGPADRGSALVAGLIVLFLGVALMKPWDAPTGGWGAAGGVPLPDSAGALPGAGATPAPTPDLSDLRQHCQEPLGWRVYSREGGNGRTVRAWRSVEPAPSASGPLDPAIPVVQLGPGIEALGYCSPWTGLERPAVRSKVQAWRLAPERRGGDGFVALALRSIAPAAPTPLGALFGPLIGGDRVGAPGQGWPAGRYVFSLSSPGWERWWAVDIAEPDRRPESSSHGPGGSSPGWPNRGPGTGDPGGRPRIAPSVAAP
jgi:hypothetical protein